MHIEQLRLTAFGPFTGCSVSLRPGLNILYGPNEAGKSSALRAIHSLLFGVPSRTADNFLHSYGQLRVGGVLVRGDDQRLECVRRKGNKATLRDGEDDKQLDESVLDRFLGAVDAEFFRSVFGIDHERLRAGGEEVIRGEGRVGELLFAAGGVSHLREIQQKLETETSQLFRARAQQPSINSAVSRLDQLRAEVREAQVSSEEWGRHDAERTRLLEQAERLGVELADAEATKERLSRISAAWPTLSSWKAKCADLQALEEAVLLPVDAEKRRTEANEQLSLAHSTLRLAQSQLERVNKQLAELQTPEAVLREQERIDQLYRRLGSHEKNAEDRGTLEARRRAARNNARQTVDRLGWSVSLEEVEKSRLADHKKVTIRTLAKQHGEIVQRLSSATKLNAKSGKRLQTLEQELTGASVGSETKGLTQALAEANSLLDVFAGLEARRDTINRLRREADEALARLPLWSGTLDELRRMKTPTEAAVEEFDERRRDITTRLSALQERMQENTESEASLLEKLAALEKGDVVPTEAELLEARAIRDRGVRLAVDTLEGRTPESREIEKFIGEVREGEALSSALGPSVLRADKVVDRLRREADHVAAKAQLVTQRDSLSRQRQNLTSSIEAAEAEQRRYAEEWNSRWASSGLTPLSPPEMRSWLRQHAQLLESASEVTSQSEALDADERRCESIRTDLLKELSAVGTEAKGTGLDGLADLAQHHIESLRSERARREQLAADIERVKVESDEAGEELREAEEFLSAWRVSWAEAMALLQLPADALPEEAESMLSNLDQLFRELDEADGFRGRVYGIDKTAEEFSLAAQELASVIAPDLAGRPVEELVATLNTRVSEARRVDQQVKTLTEQRATQEGLVRDAEASAAKSQAVLDGLLSEAGCTNTQELSKAIERSAQKRALQQQVEELKTQLAPHCGGQTLDEFQEDATTEDPDRLASKMAEVEGLVTRLREQREASLTAAEREASALTRFDGGDAAAEKEALRQSLLTQVEEDVREYVVTTVASNLLRRAIERYQERSQGPVLSLASDRFQQLTCGAFAGLKADYDESGNDILVGVRADGSSPLRVEGMSEGSRDQLYLALRLATLEHWFDHHEPVPFIVDDVLLSFDDARAEATLGALIELSARTQVLFFTHHDHLVSLARKVSDIHSGDSSVHVVTAWNGQS
ncbi:YhaN family protein [Botrimarina mediterranea]|uniref:DNA replication and repair protein RecF n=1 Tax=Botrimarina mediterranea TaxID=2528022 RepID=A0A518K7H1_9BACT|nr:YhaN family protein [Botrimarina mediterranea]QDV73735.1 DNA replication and repair protein RecF [Botrimarina mediterranea]